MNGSELPQDGNWFFTFRFSNPDGMQVMESLDDIASSVTVDELERDEHNEITVWRCILIFEEKPEEDPLWQEVRALLKAVSIIPLDPQLRFAPHQDWLDSLNKPREPISAGRFFVQGEKRMMQAPEDSIEIQMNAGLAFGSGEHETTKGCLVALDWLLKENRFSNVLDLGCGSGILAIAAAKGSSADIFASDNDKVAVEVAKDNARKNYCEANIRFFCSEGFEHEELHKAAPFDLVLANILAGPLIQLAPDVQRHLSPDGFVVLAGLLINQSPAVEAAFQSSGFSVVKKIDMDIWRILILTQ